MKKIIFLLTLVCSVVLGDEYAQVLSNVKNGICKDSDAAVLDKVCQAGNGVVCSNLAFAYSYARSSAPKKFPGAETGGTRICIYGKNQEKAIFYAELGCKYDSADACMTLGYYYNIKKDDCRSFEANKKACSLGGDSYCYNLAVDYEKGSCIEEDKTKALNLYKKACKANYQSACNNYKRLRKSVRK